VRSRENPAALEKSLKLGLINRLQCSKLCICTYMPNKFAAIGALSELLAVLSHPHRLRIVEELGLRALDVGELQGILLTSHSVVSRHLALLRAHHLVAERRIGRHVQYRLVRPPIAKWLVAGLRFVGPLEGEAVALQSAVEAARKEWGLPAKKPPTSTKATVEPKSRRRG